MRKMPTYRHQLFMLLLEALYIYQILHYAGRFLIQLSASANSFYMYFPQISLFINFLILIKDNDFNQIKQMRQVKQRILQIEKRILNLHLQKIMNSFIFQNKFFNFFQLIIQLLLYRFNIKFFKVQHLTSIMNNQFVTLNDIPDDKVVRLDNHMYSLSAFCQVHAANFQFKDYDSGTRQLKKKYGIQKQINKYFSRRNFFFSKFENGIQLDQESWYSVIPEPVSYHLGKRLKDAKVNKVFEPFCGVGGIAIHIADQFNEYIINDIDKNKIRMLKNNLKVYQKNPDSLSYYCADFLQIEPFQTDAVVICPPWGGIDISEYSFKDLDELMNPKLSDILNHGLKFSKNIMLQMPKNTNIENLLKVFIQCNISPIFTIEKIMTNGKVSQLFIYLGEQKFTKIQNSQLYLQIYSDMKIEDKKEKKDLKKKIKQKSFEVLRQVYRIKNPRQNKHILL